MAEKRNVKLQVFASDVDPDAIASAREGLYPDAIAADVSPERLARFFTKEDHGYRVSPELRSVVVFTVQDVLADPPFSRLDMISCRNLLIYLRPEAQAKVLSHFPLRAARGRHSASRQLGDGRQRRGRFEVIRNRSDLSPHRPQLGRETLVFSMGGRACGAFRAPGQGQTASRQGVARRSLSTSGHWRTMRRRRC